MDLDQAGRRQPLAPRQPLQAHHQVAQQLADQPGAPRQGGQGPLRRSQPRIQLGPSPDEPPGRVGDVGQLLRGEDRELAEHAIRHQGLVPIDRVPEMPDHGMGFLQPVEVIDVALLEGRLDQDEEVQIGPGVHPLPGPSHRAQGQQPQGLGPGGQARRDGVQAAPQAFAGIGLLRVMVLVHSVPFVGPGPVSANSLSPHRGPIRAWAVHYTAAHGKPTLADRHPHRR
jgi:hypothetical protein